MLSGAYASSPRCVTVRVAASTSLGVCLSLKVMVALRVPSAVLPLTENARVDVTTGCAALRVSMGVS